MIQMVIMLVFCLYLVIYGLIALFRKQWIWRLRDFSAGIEGKDKGKRDSTTTDSMNKMGNIMGATALILGIVGLVMNIMMIVITFQN